MPLALWTEERRPSGGGDAADGRLARFAGHSFALVDAVQALKRPFAAFGVTVVHERRSLAADGAAEGGFDGAQEAQRPLRRQSVGLRQRVNPGRMKRLVAIDVAQPRDGALIHQQCLDLTAAAEHAAKLPSGGFQRFDADFGEPSAYVIRSFPNNPYSAEAPRVAEAKLAAGPGHDHAKVRVRFDFGLDGNYGEPAGHAQPEDQLHGRGEFDHHLLGPPIDPDYLPPRKELTKWRRVAVDYIRACQMDGAERPPGKVALKLAGDGFGFGKFGHDRRTLSAFLLRTEALVCVGGDFRYPAGHFAVGDSVYPPHRFLESGWIVT